MDTTLKAKLEDLQQKARERTVKTQNIEYDLETLAKKIKNGVIKLDPEYQRRYRWSDEVSSGLIESLILNIPIPLIYISQDVDVDEEVGSETARYSVIDGQQRLTAISRYLRNEFSLAGLTVLNDLIGSYYKDLPPFLIRRLEERTLRCLRIDSTVDEQVKYDIFERLNSGSVKLELQELRNAVSRGEFNQLIKDLAKDVNFRILLQIDLEDPESNKKVKKMEDVELVLRFFALSGENYKTMKKGFKQFLSDEMNRMNKLSSGPLETMSRKFTNTMAFIRREFGNQAFAKSRYEGGAFVHMSNFNAAVYDALAVAIGDTIDMDRPQLPSNAKKQYADLFMDAKFFSSIEGSVNDQNKIESRITAVKRILA
ncbi:hypothetical protein BH11PLA2_BH11PLA2_10920 [soil metagenome]